MHLAVLGIKTFFSVRGGANPMDPPLPYAFSTFSHYVTIRSLRSADTQLLTVPRSRLVFTDRRLESLDPLSGTIYQ